MKILRGIGKALGWTLIGIVGLVALIIFLIYLPPIQDLIVNKALGIVNRGEGMEIGVKKLRLYFPLELEADSLTMRTDGMDISARRAEVSVAMLPLFGGRIFAPSLRLEDASVNMGTPDSTLYMLTHLESASVSDAEIGLKEQTLDLRRLEADGGRMSLTLLYDTVVKPVAPPDTTVRWRVRLHEAELGNLSYRMQYLPTIDSLDCSLVNAKVKEAEVYLADNTVKVKDIQIKGVDATYLTPSAEYLASHPLPPPPAATPPVDTVSTPWTVTVERLHLWEGNGLYATRGVVPASPNFDPAYIEVSEIDIQVDSLRNRGVEVRVPIKRIYGRERSGIPLTLMGLFDMDEEIMRAEGMSLTTPTSRITLDATLGMADSIATAPMDVDLQAEIGPEDLRRLVPPTLEPFTKALPPYASLKARVEAEGTMQRLEVNTLGVELPGYISVEASGRIAEMSNLDRAVGALQIKGNMRNGEFLKPALLDAKMQREISLPPLTLKGNATLDRGVIDGSLKVATPGGRAALQAYWNNRAEGYDIELKADTFPVQSFMPLLGLRNVTATVRAKGQRLDILSPKAELEADVVLTHAVYNRRVLENSTLNAVIANGRATVMATSRNPQADFSLKASGNLDSLPYHWNIDGDVRHLDLLAIGLADTTSQGSVKLAGLVLFNPAVPPTRRHPGKPMTAGASLTISEVDWHMPDMDIAATDLGLRALANDSSTQAELTNHDLRLRFAAPLSADTLMGRFTSAMGVLDKAMRTRQLQVDSLHQVLPPFYMQLDAGPDNILASYLQNSHISFDQLRFRAQNGKEISASGYATGITAGAAGTTRIDSVAVDLMQENDLLAYQLVMENQPGTFDEFAHVTARGAVSPHNFTITLNQKNVKGETGYSLGAVATMPDTSTVRLKFVPFHPIIGYKDWQVNTDNFLSYNFDTHHIDANLDLRNTLSYIQIYTNHPQEPPPMLNEFAVSDAEITHDAAQAEHLLAQSLPQQEDLVVKISNILLSDWISLNPFAPKITGALSADLNLSMADKSLNGRGTASLTDFTYGRKRVGSFDVDLDLTTNASGTIRAAAAMKVDGTQVLTAQGNLNDSTARSPFLLDLRVIHFPLSVVNPFLPPETATLRGTLNGEMDVTGELSAPLLNGSLSFDSTAVNVYMVGTDFRFSGEKIPVENSVVSFDNFQITGCNQNPLVIDGTVDIASFSDPKIDLSLSAQNMMVVNGKQRRNVPIYGKGYVSLDGTVKGPMHFLKVNADLTLLSASDVTYVVQDLQTALASRSNQNLVKFVNFADTSAVESADTLAIPESMMMLTAGLNIQNGATVNVDLSTNGRNKVQVLPSGKITYVLAPLGNETVNGRLYINGGFVRYTPPLMSEKVFDFNENSYVSFNGDMMNPTLNVSATDVTRVNVTTGGNSRMVNFDISVIVTGTLEQMNVTFDVTSPDDVTVQNELSSMSQQQRASQAMNLLLYNVYSGPGNTADFSAAGGNPLFSFLESRLNSWASTAIKGVDLTFGIDQFDKTVDGVKSTATSYSYQVSKSLFDNRFKIVVGGNYTDDPQANENFAQNLIADISFEYMLNKQGTMYIRLFRHTGYESILEGEVTQTGVGFVYKKKISRIADMFRFVRHLRRKKSPSPQTPPTDEPHTIPSATPQQ